MEFGVTNLSLGLASVIPRALPSAAENEVKRRACPGHATVPGTGVPRATKELY